MLLHNDALKRRVDNGFRMHAGRDDLLGAVGGQG